MMAEGEQRKAGRRGGGPATRSTAGNSGYIRPSEIIEIPVESLPNIPSAARIRLDVPNVYCAGHVELLQKKLIAIVGAREVTEDGARRASRLGRLLAQHDVVTVSGLAKGVDYAAHTGAIAAGGRTIAVIGTPLEKAYPAAHGSLQERIWREHLLLSQFAPGSRVFPSNFPARNLLMAAITHATVIVEASDTSGSLHQAAECARLGRPLFIAKSVVEDARLTWPARFLKPDFPVYVLTEVDDILRVVGV